MFSDLFTIKFKSIFVLYSIDNFDRSNMILRNDSNISSSCLMDLFAVCFTEYLV